MLAVNLTGPFLCSQAAAPLIRDSGGGAIVNITSISGLRASTLRTAYGTSKAGLAHLTQQQAIELASLGIRVNAVAGTGRYWCVIEPHLPATNVTGRPRAWPMREIINGIFYVMRDANKFAVAYVYFESEPARRAAANLMTKDEARKIAAGIAKLPELLLRPDAK